PGRKAYYPDRLTTKSVTCVPGLICYPCARSYLYAHLVSLSALYNLVAMNGAPSTALLQDANILTVHRFCRVRIHAHLDAGRKKTFPHKDI
ncbi:hypothetical protein ABIE06_002107, partial [Pantoea dispersa]|uniref:hypothetical protein n=1 Tax=Pantoea dispersa TaxID=59814 RepID=UPI003D208115